jgi:N-acetyllactosaminide alpha-2,3-sialyltransferase
MDISDNSLTLRQRKALVLCRTPFQAVMIRHVLSRECIDRYDLVYLTQNNTDEDTHYFEELSASAEKAQYIFLEKQKYDILNHAKTYWNIKRNLKRSTYDKIIISSFDNLAFRKITVRNKHSEIISFDDGTGYLIKPSKYLEEQHIIRSVIYGKLFLVPLKKDFIRRIDRHYSAYRHFENIMPPEIIRYVDLFQNQEVENFREPAMKFFIGQPFEEFGDVKYVSNLKTYMSTIELDFYVRHPRESFPLIEGVPILPKEGRIAEDAIFKISRGRRPVIFGAFSTLLLNISPALADKAMILRHNVARDAYYAEMGEKAGCQIVYL